MAKINKRTIIEIAVLLAVMILGLGYFTGLRHFSFTAPMNYDSTMSGDLLARAKMICTGSWTDNQQVGVPQGTSLVNSKGFLMTSLDAVILKVLYLIFGNVGAALNIYIVLMFIGTAMSTYIVFKKMKMGSFYCIVGATMLAFSTYMFGMTMIEFGMVNAIFVPVAVYFATQLYKNADFFGDNKNTVWVVIVLLLMCFTGGGYTAFFSGIIIITAGISQALKGRTTALVKAAAMASILLVVSLLLNLPYYLNGDSIYYYNNYAVADADVNSIKLVKLFFPVCSAFDRYNNFYDKYTVFISPINNSSYLGLAGIIGLVILVLSLFVSIGKKDKKNQNVLLMELLIVLIFVCQTGGLGTVLTFLFNGGLTDYGKGVIYIDFICITVFLLYAQKLMKKTKHIIGVLIAILVIFIGSLYTSFPNNFKGFYGNPENLLTEELKFIQSIEETLGNDAKVYQANVTGRYKPINDLNGSFVKLPNRSIGFYLSEKINWNIEVAGNYDSQLFRYNIGKMAVSEAVNALIEAGYDGVFIDRSNYLGVEYLEIELYELENVLSEITGKEWVYGNNTNLEYIRLDNKYD